MTSLVLAASTRTRIADYVGALFEVYLIMIFAYVVLSIMFSAGIRIPYSRWSTAVIDFLRQVVEPYLAIFRRVLPSMGPFDLSPLVGTFVLIIVWRVVVSAIGG
jgi:YggT family protein